MYDDVRFFQRRITRRTSEYILGLIDGSVDEILNRCLSIVALSISGQYFRALGMMSNLFARF